MKIKSGIFLAVLAAAGGLIAPRPAHAYLDPGTGSFIIQVLIGAAVGGGYLVKTYWRQIKSKFHQIRKKDSQPNDQSTAEKKS